MKKIHGLRRTGVLLFALGIGVLIGRNEMSLSSPIVYLAFILWLLIYDFAAEKQYQGRVKRAEKRREEQVRTNDCNV